MSEEGWVMLAEMARDAIPKEVTPLTGEGALGKWRARLGDSGWTPSQRTDAPRGVSSWTYNRAF